MAAKHRAKVLLMLVLQFVVFATMAQGVDAKASAPRVVSVGEAFQVVYTVNKQPTSFQQPDLSAFLYSGPSVSRSFSTSIINGQVSQEAKTSYVYVVQIQKEGKFTLPAAKFVVDGKAYSTQSLTVEVVKGQAAASQQQAQPQGRQRETGGQVGDNDFFVRLNVDKHSVYEGEPILATIKIYTRVGISGFEDVKLPNFDGFWAQELESPQRINLQRENVDGIIYDVGVVRKSLLFPQRSGEIKIDPVQITAVVRYRVQQQSFWDDGYRETSKKAKSAPVKLNVKKLPTPQPGDFTGAVGNFSLKASVDKNSLKANDAVTYKLVVQGSGNLRLINAPKVDFPADFDKFDPKTTQDIKSNEKGAFGSKTFEYVLIPRYKGNFTIPSVSFSYFDPASGQYRQVKTQAIALDVAEGDASSSYAVTDSNFKREEVKNKGTDIRFIKTDSTDLSEKGKSLYNSVVYWAYFLILAALFGIMVAFKQKQIRQNKNLSLVRTKKAGKVSQKRLKIAKKHMDEGKKEVFFEETLRALWGYIGDKLGIEQSRLTKDNIRETLEKRQIESDTIDRLLKVVDDCELARYAPVSDASMQGTFAESGAIIEILEQKL